MRALTSRQQWGQGSTYPTSKREKEGSGVQRKLQVGRAARQMSAPVWGHYRQPMRSPASVRFNLSSVPLLSFCSQLFSFMLQLRRAKWALESSGSGRTLRASTASAPNTSYTRTAAQSTSATTPSLPSPSAAAARQRLWWLLRAEVLAFVQQLHSYFALAVIQSEWTAFSCKVPQMRDVDGVREAHEQFLARTAERCLLLPRFEPILREIRQILTLALRLRLQLDSIAPLPVAAHAVAVARWRGELRDSIGFVLRTLKRTAEDGPRDAQLLEIFHALNFNGFYHSQWALA
eukprot:6211740-Pleurochrysis_carterae.AAC.1